MESGADLAIGSVHKTLNGLAQTSVLSTQGDRIDSTRLQLVVELEQSSSASSLLLSSIDAARRQFQRDGERLLGQAIDRARRLRDAVGSMPGLDLMGEDIVGGPGVAALDPTHVTFDVVGLGLTGFAAADWLREHHRVHLELSDHRRLIPLVCFAHTTRTSTASSRPSGRSSMRTPGPTRRSTADPFRTYPSRRHCGWRPRCFPATRSSVMPRWSSTGTRSDASRRR